MVEFFSEARVIVRIISVVWSVYGYIFIKKARSCCQERDIGSMNNCGVPDEKG